jgi:glucose-1-phosphatase
VPRQAVRAIIFDIGRVLVRVDVARAMADLAADTALTPQDVLSAIENDPRWTDWQEGRMAPRDWHLHLCHRLGAKMGFERFRDVWNGALDPKPVFEDSFFEKLARSYHLGLLSNTDPLHVEHLEATFSFFRFFPARTYSCRIGASKPNPLVYREALRASRVSAAQAIYIDDIPAFAEAAGHLGVTAMVFRSKEQLFTDFSALGIGFA